MKFQAPQSIASLLDAAFMHYAEHTQDTNMTSHGALNILLGKRHMLNEYFAIDIDANGQLCGLPLLLQKYTPNFSKLPLFLLRLATRVDYMREKQCFVDVATQLSLLFAVDSSCDDWTLEHVVSPALRKYLQVPLGELEHCISLVTDLHSLYKVFERC